MDRWIVDYDYLKPSIILQGVTGSTAHGLALPGNEDRDEIEVCIEPIGDAITLGQPFEQYIHRTAAVRESKHDARSQAGDLDLTVFSLRKFCRLAAAGNPSMLLLFFTPDLTYCNALGGMLRERSNLFISKEAGHRFLGYMHGQRQRLLGERGQKRVRRPELEEAFGFDTKYAMHVLRLGTQGIELMKTGRLTLPMESNTKAFLMNVRQGKMTLQEVINIAGVYEDRIKELLETTTLPEHPDRPAIEKLIQNWYLNWWKASQPLLKLDGLGFKEYFAPTEHCQVHNLPFNVCQTYHIKEKS